MEEIEYEKYFAILEKRKQFFFYGPPGTGKTYTAKKIAERFVDENTTKGTKLTFRNAAFHILKENGKPMHYKDELIPKPIF
jgi:5-methylcytosine-specific restriction protein B